MKKLVVIFDMEGVITDSRPFHIRAWRDFCKGNGVGHLSDEEIDRQTHGVNKDNLKRLFGDDLIEREIEEYSRIKEEMYREIYDDFIKPTEGLVEFLGMLKENEVEMGISTASPPENVEFVLRKTDTRHFFPVITDDSEVENGKPHPEVYLKTAEKMNCSPSDCVVFEDSIPGIRSAKAAGMKVIGITTTYPKEELLEAEVDHVIDDFREVSLDLLNFLRDSELSAVKNVLEEEDIEKLD
jgi:HAD superfamily hydrolase (TIGR01509 family)|tara:strand:+ start:110 stop:829 length:720 start_codon:yes stop_codon:yes gene_type:complete